VALEAVLSSSLAEIRRKCFSQRYVGLNLLPFDSCPIVVGSAPQRNGTAKHATGGAKRRTVMLTANGITFNWGCARSVKNQI
jgi:hypothetical protein